MPRIGQPEIIDYLANNPNKNITEIIEGTGGYRNTISNGIKSLVENGLVTSLSKDRTYGEKGKEYDRWGLDTIGIGNYITSIEYNPELVRNVIQNYKPYNRQAEVMHTIIKILDEVKAPKVFLYKFFRNTAILLEGNVPFDEASNMMLGFMFTHLSDRQMSKILKKLTQNGLEKQKLLNLL